MNPIRHGPVEIRLNDDGSVDEIVMYDKTTGLFAHLEQMSGTGWCLGMGRYKAGTKTRRNAEFAIVTAWLTSSRKITATWEKS